MSRPLPVLLSRAQGGGGGGQRQDHGTRAPHGQQGSAERRPSAWRRETDHTINSMLKTFVTEFAAIRQNLLFIYLFLIYLNGDSVGVKKNLLSLKRFAFYS